MDFTLRIEFGFGESVEFNTTDFWKILALSAFVERIEEIEEEEVTDEAEFDEEYEYDDEGTAYWYDSENDVYYWYDLESDDWYECSDEEEVEAEDDEASE